MPDFAAHWTEAPHDVIEYEGRKLRPHCVLAVSPGDSIEIRFERFTSRPVQGLGVALTGRRGALEVASTRARQLALWTDTAPHQVSCRVVGVAPGTTLKITNQWRDEKYGTTMYSLNAAAMEILHETDGSVLLRCSDGWGTDPSFDDLVVRLRHAPAPSGD